MVVMVVMVNVVAVRLVAPLLTLALPDCTTKDRGEDAT